MIVCVCNNVSDKAINRAVAQQGVRTFIQLRQVTDVATCCGKCARCAKQVLKEALAEQAEQQHVPLSGLGFA
ncbi:(2Fe-2S)-binding protein [Deefgea salmonis]|uniref:Bacterioferritin-associated ferredoxin n=1 Tax=Deefgea salmonis TaxID=2875502 RepID=A0ABS8BIA0_9NEIS|nr:(2Fe-2S)-binding protein [Deefgea salmonis]MCB5195316.1 (2Fe-2S)-binding protein [Deefgea salmonis]